MQIITSQAFEDLASKNVRLRREKHPQIKEILSIEVGQAIIVFKKDWLPKNKPMQAITTHAKKLGRKYVAKTLADGSGWGILRVE